MATKSFMKNIMINNKKATVSFIQALENAENKGRKKVTINKKTADIKDKGAIKKMFGV